VRNRGNGREGYPSRESASAAVRGRDEPAAGEQQAQAERRRLAAEYLGAGGGGGDWATLAPPWWNESYRRC
jgi:hypothetical protein